MNEHAALSGTKKHAYKLERWHQLLLYSFAHIFQYVSLYGWIRIAIIMEYSFLSSSSSASIENSFSV